MSRAKTYAQVRRAKPFSWKRFLNKKHYTLKELTEASRKAKSWVTCACGNQCAIIPRLANGAPKDEYLGDSGANFYVAIDNMRQYYRDDFPTYVLTERNRARIILKLIEDRSTKLISQIRHANR